MKSRQSLNTDLNKYSRTYRDLGKLKILNNTDVLAQNVLQNRIQRNQKQLKELNVLIANADNRLVRTQNKDFVQRLTLIVKEQDDIDAEKKTHKIRIGHLSSQIERVNAELKKYSTLDERISADQTIETLQSQLLNNNRKIGSLKLEGTKLKTVVNDLLLVRRQFQITRDNIIANLMTKKQEIKELVDHYTIAFSHGMKNCLDLEVCQKRSAEHLKDHLQEMRQLIRAAESNDILQEFIINKATRIQLDSGAVPKRNILKGNYETLSKICEDQLTQIRKFDPKTKPQGLISKRQKTFSLYLYENEMTDQIEDSEKGMTSLQSDISLAQSQIQERIEQKLHLDALNLTLNEEQEKMKEQSERFIGIESILHKCLKEIHNVYTMLGCDTKFKFGDDQSVMTQFNLNDVLRIIEIRLRQVIYSVYCGQMDDTSKKELIHGPAIIKPRNIPTIALVNPCPECSQIEAHANPDVEKLVDIEAKITKLKENIANRNLMSKMHDIEECPKPGSKAILSKDI